MSSTSVNEVFEEAREQFLASLSDAEQSIFSQCPSAERLIVEIKNLDHVKRNWTWGRRVIGHVTASTDALKPFFQVVDTFVSSNQYAAMVWGALRVVFQLASNYTNFFEKLSKNLGRIIEVLPQYEQIAELCSGRPPNRLRSSLCKVYVDLLRFCQSVARVFTKKDGKTKRSPLVATGLFWKPFDIRFEDLLDDFRFHSDLVKHELLLAELQSAREARKSNIAHEIQAVKERMRAADQRQAAMDGSSITEETRRTLEQKHKEDMSFKFDRIHKWLSPPEFAQELERACDSREPGTAEWLFDENAFTDWVSSRLIQNSGLDKTTFGKRALWIQGNPGCGKTILAGATVEELRDSATYSTLKSPVYYHFFRSGFPALQNTLSAFRSFLAQLFHARKDDPEVIDKFAFAMNETSEGQLTASRYDLLELLLICTQCFGEAYFILDAIDECDDNKTLIQDLLNIAQKSEAKVIVFSRPNVAALFRAVPEKQQINVGRNTCEDIRIYLAKKFEEFVEEGLLPSGANAEELVEHLLVGADGMFIWARLMIHYLNSPALTRKQRLNTIMNVHLPEGIEVMYERISELICQGNQAERDLAQRIVMWLLYSSRPMTTDELQEAVLTRSAEETDNQEDDFPDFNRTVILTCAGLVERQTIYISDYGSDFSSYQFIHLSVREYFLSQASSTSPNTKELPTGRIALAVSLQDSLFEMTRTCLLYLSYRMPAQPLCGSTNSDVSLSQLRRMFPLSAYAACHWIEYLYECSIPYSSSNILQKEKLKDLMLVLSRFFTLKLVLMAWIEAIYISRHNPQNRLLEEWSKWVVGNKIELALDDGLVTRTSRDAAELSHYLNNLREQWGSQLTRSPKSIWEEITAFSPSHLLPQTGSTKVDTLIKDPLKQSTISSNYFSNISEEPPKQSTISSKCLSKISEVSSDGHLVAVLSIWPSKSYEETSQYSMRPVMSMLRRVCTDWVARYEIWSIERDPVCSADLCIPIDTDEVYLQIRRSLWQEEPSFTSGSWKVQFPLAISNDARLVSILRTVYFFTPAGGNEAKLEAVRLPLKWNKGLEAYWPEHESVCNPPQSKGTEQSSKPGFRTSLKGLLHPNKTSQLLGRSRSQRRLEPQSTIYSHGRSRSHSDVHLQGHDGMNDSPVQGWNIYLFWFSFSPDRRYLFFIDLAPKTQSNVAIFILSTSGKFKVSLLRYSKISLRNDTTLDMPNLKTTFHPSEPLVAFMFAERDAQVVLWAFNHGDRAPTSIHVGSSFDPLEDVHFSSNGQYVVISQRNSTTPEIIPIDPALLSPVVKLIDNPASAPAPSATVSLKSSGTLATTPSLGPPVVLRGEQGYSLVQDDGSSAGLSIEHSDNEISVRSWQQSSEGDNSHEEVVQITKVPNWAGSSASSAAISMPSASNDAVRIVLNKTAHEWSDMTDTEDTHLPALVRRDPRALVHTSGKQIEGQYPRRQQQLED